MIPQIQPTELKALLDSGRPVLLLDVRQPEEHAFCALPGSVLIPLGELMARVEEVQPEGATVVVYGRWDRPLVAHGRSRHTAILMGHVASEFPSEAAFAAATSAAAAMPRLNFFATGMNRTATTASATANTAKYGPGDMRG